MLKKKKHRFLNLWNLKIQKTSKKSDLSLIRKKGQDNLMYENSTLSSSKQVSSGTCTFCLKNGIPSKNSTLIIFINVHQCLKSFIIVFFSVYRPLFYFHCGWSLNIEEKPIYLFLLLKCIYVIGSISTNYYQMTPIAHFVFYHVTFILYLVA